MLSLAWILLASANPNSTFPLDSHRTYLGSLPQLKTGRFDSGDIHEDTCTTSLPPETAYLLHLSGSMSDKSNAYLDLERSRHDPE